MGDDEKKSDEELALSVQNGDKEAFGILMDRYNAKISRYAKKFLRDNDVIEDKVQDVFIKAYENIKSFDTKRFFSPWIYRIAHNVFINEIKKKKEFPLSIFEIDTMFPHLSYTDAEKEIKRDERMKEVVDRGLDKISLKYREILILYYIENLSYKEIAEVLEVPLGTIGIRLKRARESLKKYVPEDLLEDNF